MKRKSILLTTLSIVFCGVMTAVIISGSGKAEMSEAPRIREEAPHDTHQPYVPEKIDFCGEVVPLERRDVFESLEREMIVTTFAHTNTSLILKRMHRYFPMIENILKEEGIPEDFKYLAVTESNLYDISRSPVGAIGIWQFMEATGKEYGLEINSEIDERYNIEKSTRAACKYLRKAYAEFGSWTLVAASYNGGMNGVKKAMSLQKQSSYYDMLWLEETARYVFRIVAFKALMSDPDKYGFHIDKDGWYEPWKTTTVEIDSTIPDLAQFAIDKGTTYKRVKELNRWIRQNKITNARRKTYRILIPNE